MHRTHASAEAYDPFEDTEGPVGNAAHFEVQRIPGIGTDEPAQFVKKPKASVRTELRKMMRHEQLLLLELQDRTLPHVAQSVSFNWARDTQGFTVTTLDAGPSLNLWRRYDFERLGDAAQQARPFLTPRVFLLLMRHMLLALRDFHGAGYIHADIHAGNICLPFERMAGHPQAVRPRFDRLCLIDFGHTLSPLINLDEPLRLDPDDPESLRRVSPAFRAALRSDAKSQRASEVLKLDFRIDLFALGALGAQLLSAVDWADEPDAIGLHPEMARAVDALLATDHDGKPAEAGLHERLLAPLDALLGRWASSGVEWLLPRARSAARSAAASPEAARETPLIVSTSEAPLSAVTPLVPPPAPPEGTGNPWWAGPLVLPEEPSPRSPVVAASSEPTRRNLLAGIVAAVGAGAVIAWWLHGPEEPSAGSERAPPAVPEATSPAASSPSPAPLPGPAPAPAPTPVQPPAPVAESVPAPAAPAPNDLLAAANDRLAQMLRGADAGDWDRVEQAAQAIPSAAAQRDGTADAATIARAESRIRARQYKQASALLARATASAPNDGAAWSALGYALLRQRRLDEAQDALQTSLRLQPASSAAWTHLAEVLAGQNRQKAAVAALKLGVYFSPRRSDVLTYLRGPALNTVSPALRAIVRAQGRRLDELPERER